MGEVKVAYQTDRQRALRAELDRFVLAMHRLGVDVQLAQIYPEEGTVVLILAGSSELRQAYEYYTHEPG